MIGWLLRLTKTKQTVTLADQTQMTNPSKSTSLTFPEAIGDGAQIAAGGRYNPGLGFDFNSPAGMSDRLEVWRSMANYAEMAEAVGEIVDSAVVVRTASSSGKISQAVCPVFIDDSTIPESIQRQAIEAWDLAYRRLRLHRDLTWLFKTWYIDGRLFVHKIVDSQGLARLVQIDPLNITRIKIVDLPDDAYTGLIKTSTEERDERLVYVYRNISSKNNMFNLVPLTNTPIAVDKESIAYADSGIYDKNGQALSFLDKSVIPFNIFRQMEGAMGIFRAARATARTVFYIDTGALTGKKAEEFVDAQIGKFKSSISYDPLTGKLNDRLGGASILEDLWIPRREGSTATTAEPLNTASPSFSVDDVRFEHERLLRSSGVPTARLIDDQNPFSNGEDITYAEHKFSKKIDQLRISFEAQFLEDIFVSQLVALGIIDTDQVDQFLTDINWKWENDGLYEDLRVLSKLERRLTVATSSGETNFIPRERLIRTVFDLSETEYKDWENEIASKQENQQ